jgi:hypothetical protein
MHPRGNCSHANPFNWNQISFKLKSVTHAKLPKGLEKKTTQAVKTTPHIVYGKESHFGTEYRPLPADTKGIKDVSG